MSAPIKILVELELVQSRNHKATAEMKARYGVPEVELREKMVTVIRWMNARGIQRLFIRLKPTKCDVLLDGPDPLDEHEA